MSEQDVEAACEVMHDAYEAAAIEVGWETQQRSRKPWADVPEANKATMRAAVRALLDSPLIAERERMAAERALAPVRALLASAEQRTALSLSRDFNGNKWDSPIPQDDLRAAFAPEADA